MILGSGIRLRAVEKGDIPRFVIWLNDPEVTQFLLISSPLSRVMEENWFERQAALPPHEGQVLAIDVLENEEWIHIGNTGLHNIDQVSRTAEFGIFIGDKSHWNRSCGTRATELMLLHGFDHLNLNRIYLHVYQNNPRGIRAYEKAGFVKEGILREGVYKNGLYLDLIVMSVLHSEWIHRKG